MKDRIIHNYIAYNNECEGRSQGPALQPAGEVPGLSQLHPDEGQNNHPNKPSGPQPEVAPVHLRLQSLVARWLPGAGERVPVPHRRQVRRPKAHIQVTRRGHPQECMVDLCRCVGMALTAVYLRMGRPAQASPTR